MQRVTPRGQLLDPFGELPLDVGEGCGELLGVGVEQEPDLGQRHAGSGQRPGRPPKVPLLEPLVPH
ncbi:hypothetical protein AB0G73_15985 [Streptomyces sp. NPDC020719]|uniref:hypothetical protein n=1 Tax=Streptomyces sp. NPDC020719 TaxID=3154896 RepID=UPI0033F58D93